MKRLTLLLLICLSTCSQRPAFAEQLEQRTILWCYESGRCEIIPCGPEVAEHSSCDHIQKRSSRSKRTQTIPSIYWWKPVTNPSGCKSIKLYDAHRMVAEVDNCLTGDDYEIWMDHIPTGDYFDDLETAKREAMAKYLNRNSGGEK